VPPNKEKKEKVVVWTCTIIVYMELYEGGSINKLQNGVILLFFKI